jgi:hypothetical protein
MFSIQFVDTTLIFLSITHLYNEIKNEMHFAISHYVQ